MGTAVNEYMHDQGTTFAEVSGDDVQTADVRVDCLQQL